MKARVFVLSLLLALPMTGFAQSTLNFPKFFSSTDLPNSGFTIVNPGPTTANVTFTLYAANGSVVSTSTATSFPALGPGTQQALLGNQIFPTLGSGGWVQATSTTSGLQGFWLVYNGSLTYLDGAVAATAAVNQAIPLVAGSTTINVANPNSTGTTVAFQLRGSDGTQYAPAVTETIPAFGVFDSDAFTLFGVTAPTETVYVRVISGSTNALAATAFVTNYLVPAEAGVINGVDESSTATTLNLPQVVTGPAGGPNYTTVLGVTDLSGVAQTVTATFYSCPTDSATSVAACTALPSVQIALNGRGSSSNTLQSLFGLSATAFAQGWIQLTAPLPIAGFAAYADLVDGALAVVPAQTAGSTNLMFSYIANLYPSDPWETGIALLNPTTKSASVQIYAMTPAGVLLGGASTDPTTANLTIPANSRSALGLSQMIPESGPTATHTKDGGFIFVQSTVPIFGTELFYNSAVTILANVPAGNVATGTNYVPPSPPQPLTLTSVSPTRVATGGTITLSGTGFSTSGGADTITFTTAAGTTTATAMTATSTTLTLFLPPTAITGPVTVTTGGQTSSAVILEILASPMAIAQNTFTVTAGSSTVSGVDIYVDPPAAAAGNILTLSEIGVAAVGATSIPFNDVSATVTQGTQVQVLLYGSGISAANGTALTFSGSGITVSNVTYGTLSGATYLVAQIAISAGATAGPRNVILTNSNLDVSVLSGGLIILTSE